MPIRWDSLLTRHLARELHATLAGSRLRALRFDARTRDVVLIFRERTLLWRLHPERSSLVLREPIEPQEGDVRLKARVRSVTSVPDDRVIRFELSGPRRGVGPWEFIVELLGNQMNAVVTEGSARTLRHVLRTRHGKRPMRVGHAYEPPSSTARVGATTGVSEDEWLSIVERVPPPDLPKELTRGVSWVSPLNVDAFIPDAYGENDHREAYRRWLRMTEAEAPTEAVVLRTNRGLQPYPCPVPGQAHEPADSLLDAFALAAHDAAADADEAVLLTLGPELLERLADAVAHAERRVVRLQSELDGRENPELLRGLGDLILARYSDVPAGAESVELLDFVGEPVSVELDPKLRPHANAERYYDRAARSERAAERLPDLIARASAARDRLRAIESEAHRGHVDVDAVRAAVPPAPKRQRRGGQPSTLPYRTFRSTGGLEIRVGRGARYNDDLTFRHSAPEDIWLHARHAAGAHVILRWQREDAPPSRDLEEAGVLAALNSRARTSSSVPVDWTRRKHVRKPRGSAAGSVVPDRVKTIFVNPDERVVERLATEE